MNNSDKKPLTISINGSLGNQLFILFAGISKAINENRDYYIYIEDNKYNYYFNNFLHILYDKVINYNNIETDIITVYNEPNLNYNEIPDNYDLIKGHYLSYKYFDNYSNIIINNLNINIIKNNYKINLKSIAIYFNFNVESIYNNRILSFVYYLKAILYLNQQLNDFDEYIFIIYGEKKNDNKINEYINQINFNLNKTITFIKIYDRYPNINDYEEFLYMSDCNHFIIDNSAFSWFSAFLSNNNNKIIIHPSQQKLFINDNFNFKDYFINDWIEIDY